VLVQVEIPKYTQEGQPYENDPHYEQHKQPE